MPKGYSKKKHELPVDRPVDNQSSELENLEIIAPAIPEAESKPEPEEVEEQGPPKSLEEAPALLKSGFMVPNHLRFRSIKTQREAPRWSARHLQTKAEVYKGNEFVRVYELEVHGKGFHEMADMIVKKHNVLLE